MTRDLRSGGAAPGAFAAREQRANVQAQLLHIAYGRLHLNLVMTVLVVALFAVVPWRHFSTAPMLAWLGALLAASGLRYLDLRAYLRSDPAVRHDSRRRPRLIAGAAAAGAAWSFGPLALIEATGHPESYLLALTLLAVTAISTVSWSAQLAAMWTFQVTALLPTALALYATGGEIEKMAALIVFAGLLALMATGRSANATVRSQIEAELGLAASLKDADAARERAESASRAKSRFLANMSHELRTPLNAVIGAAQLMKTDGQNAARRLQLVEAIQRSGTNLLGLIENILDLSRIEAGEMKLHARDFHLVECVDAAMATATLAAHAKGLQMSCIVDPQLPVWRRGDEARLRQVLLNLLGNAVKFTARGDVRVHVRRAAGGDGVSIDVVDSGIGIDAAALPHVFEPFRQADEGADRRYGGSGLGLAIVQQVARAMDGRVSVQSEVGRGTRFTLELPLPIASRSPAAPPSRPPQEIRVASPEAGAQAAARVLVVEDDALNQTIVCRLLQHAGYQAAAAGNGASALAALRDQDFDLVLMDWQMPDMDGLEVTRRVRAGEAGSHAQRLPIVALTANAFAEDREACLAAGMNDFLTKPVDAASLARTIERWLRPGSGTAVPTVPSMVAEPAAAGDDR